MKHIRTHVVAETDSLGSGSGRQSELGTRGRQFTPLVKGLHRTFLSKSLQDDLGGNSVLKELPMTQYLKLKQEFVAYLLMVGGGTILVGHNFFKN